VTALLPASKAADLPQVEPFGPDPSALVPRYGRGVAPLPEIRATSVVLADDDDRFRALVRSVLEQDGYDVVGEAANAASARAATREHRPDVVILDLVMVGSRGLSTLRELLDDDPGQPVLVISSLFDPIIEQEVVALGAWYLEKSEGLDALEHMIDGMVSVSQHAR
jgi:DNA-binding NarL/FixJ family response regulator